ncbi:CIA30 family protein [Pseudocolwellia sp. HL-MZ19]|uniref:CIA30 family protein n=1 Tax=Pseudocolwellia sp. HL-MZ19 TaxID=3400846 RepID=UPI003CFA68FD
MPLHTLNNSDDWLITNDSVMGGLSKGHTFVEDNTVTFSGFLSTENSGGFSSVFKKLSGLSESIKSVTIAIKGDGKPYQLRVRTQVMGYELAYKINFDTSIDTVTNHTFKLSDFEASFRGRIISNAPLLKASTITHVGFLLSAKQPSHFSLNIYSIEFI